MEWLQLEEGACATEISVRIPIGTHGNVVGQPNHTITTERCIYSRKGVQSHPQIEMLT
jgi:hypothetical protein